MQQQQIEVFFDALTAAEVVDRLRLQAEINSILNAIALTTARMNGARGDDRVMLNNEGTGIVIIRNAVGNEYDEAGEVLPEAAAAGKAPKRPQAVTTE